jgi:AraC-like DNA-binding protein
MEERPIRNLGARLAAETPFGAFPLVDYLAVTSPSVGGALSQLARYLRLTEAPYTMVLETEGDPVRVVFDKPPNPFAAEFGVTLTLLHLRRETDGPWTVVTASFAHTPDDPNELEQLLGCPVAINQSWNGFRLRREVWDLPMRRRDPVLFNVLEQRAAEIAARMPDASDVARDVAWALARRLPKGEATIENVAHDLATSTRSLQRRLTAAGLTFQQLLDEARRDSASLYLADPKLSVGEVAYLLGYSEPGPFHRAFKRWHGVTPQAFRKQRAKAELSGNSLYF